MIDSLLLTQSEASYSSVKQSQKSYSGGSVQEKLFSHEYMKIEETSLSIKDNQLMFVSRTIEMSIKQEFVSSSEYGVSGTPAFLLGNQNYSSYTNKAIYESYVQIATGEGEDYWGAEQTSQRIVDLATSFGELWKIENPESEGKEFEGFLDKLEQSINQGFSEALLILESVNFLSEKVKDVFKETYDLTMEKLRNNFDNLLSVSSESISVVE